MGTENYGGGGGLDDLKAQHGVTTGMSGGYTGDSSDFQVMIGWSDPPRTAAPLAGDVRRMEATGQVSTPWGERTPSTKRSSELEKQFYSMADEDLPELQRRLWAGGFYPPGANPDEIVLGDRDLYSEKAWQNALTRAGKFLAAGRKLTLDEVIDMGANLEGAGKARGGGAGGGAGGGRAPLVTELANPEDLKYYAQRTAVATLGRGLKPDELERFVASFHGSQQASQAQAYGAGGSGGPGGTVVGAPSPAAAAESFARQAAPVEAGAHDAVKVFDSMSKLLGGKRGRG